MERRTLVCAYSAWHSLLISVNRKGGGYKVKKSALLEVQQCHRRHSPHRVPVNDRASLLNFIIDHGEVCGKAITRDGFVPARLKRAERIQDRINKLEEV